MVGGDVKTCMTAREWTMRSRDGRKVADELDARDLSKTPLPSMAGG